jgi:hypothetical protein
LHIFIALVSLPSARAQVVVEDIFGRRLNEHGLVLVDWEGPMANPAIKFFVVPPADAAYPARAVLTASEPRIYFDLPSEIGPRGPRKVIDFKKGEKRPVLVSIFSNLEGEDQHHELQLAFQDARGRKQAVKLACHVVDQDKKVQKGFRITLDFSQDRTGFFKHANRRQVVTQAAEDWTYFFEPVTVDAVPAGKEKTFIWNPDGFKSGRFVTNAREYTGYLLYAYGIKSGELRSGGEPSRAGGFQSHKGKPLGIRRSGGVEIEIQGNYNTRGWLVSLAAGDFYRATNLGEVPNDLYSIAHHEIGHALVFNPANPRFEMARKAGKLQDAALKVYLKADPTVDKADHLNDSIDPASRRGAFGYEYHGDMPQCRWQITKVDLLCAQAVGWPLRKTSAFVPLKLDTEAAPAGVVGKKYKHQLPASGGIPFYNWEVTAGSLPVGLRLNSFSGVISGTPAKAGVFNFTVRVRDYDERAAGQSARLRLEIGPG